MTTFMCTKCIDLYTLCALCIHFVHIKVFINSIHGALRTEIALDPYYQRWGKTHMKKYLLNSPFKVKRADPNAACHIQHDKLYVNNRIFVWNDLQGKVTLV